MKKLTRYIVRNNKTQKYVYHDPLQKESFEVDELNEATLFSRYDITTYVGLDQSFLELIKIQYIEPTETDLELIEVLVNITIKQYRPVVSLDIKVEKI